MTRASGFDVLACSSVWRPGAFDRAHREAPAIERILDISASRRRSLRRVSGDRPGPFTLHKAAARFHESSRDGWPISTVARRHPAVNSGEDGGWLGTQRSDPPVRMKARRVSPHASVNRDGRKILRGPLKVHQIRPSPAAFQPVRPIFRVRQDQACTSRCRIG
jgi:hypothetical protein